MNMRESDIYESYAGYIANSIFEKIEGVKAKRLTYGANSKWTGVSGYEHQIDVIVEGNNDLILVECKCWKSTIPTNSVLTFISRVHDIRPTFQGTTHPIMLTKIGYDPGAEVLAKYYGIELQYAPDEESFSFFFKNNLVIKPKPASATATTAGCTVVITDNEGNIVE
jgi:hypothetical protein